MASNTSRTVPGPITPNPDAFQGVEINDTMDDDGWDETLADLNFQYMPEVVPAEAGHHYRFRNIDIQFPYKAYRSQEQLMDKIIEGVTTGQHCLLESPTGTGKTAALLCALLAWQKQMKREDFRKIVHAAVAQLGDCQCGLITDENRTQVVMENRKGKFVCIATTITPAEATSTSPSSPSPSSPSPCGSNSKCGCNSKNDSPTKHMPSPVICANLSQPVTSTKAINFPQHLASKETNMTTVLNKTTESPSKRRKISSSEPSSPNSPTYTETKIEKSVDDLCKRCSRKYLFDTSRPPKIYYCTRTHSQIAQVVKQLKNTAYRNSMMTILSSRDPTCISDSIRDKILKQLELEKNLKMKKDKNGSYKKEGESSSQDKEDESDLMEKQTLDDICKRMKSNYYKQKKINERNRERELEAQINLSQNPIPNIGTIPEEEKLPTCEYYRPEEFKSKFSTFQKMSEAWNLEDIKSQGKCLELCPFFGCKTMHEDADIIFCPYNYLIDPDIRKASSVRYVNSIIVFDEAHNIEDICRQAYSIKIDITDFDKYVCFPIENLLSLLHFKEASCAQEKQRALEKLLPIFKKWSQDIKDTGNLIKIPLNSTTVEAQESLEDKDLFQFLKGMEMDYSTIEWCRNLVAEVNLENDSVQEYYISSGKMRPFVVNSSVDNFLVKLQRVLEYIFKQEKDGIGGSQDYRGCLTKKSNPSYAKKTPKGQPSDQKPEPEFLFSFQIICLNPAVGFHTLKSTTFAVIVASGTLTPLDSFACELATKFNVTLQAEHVIPVSHVWTGVVCVDTKNNQLELTKSFQNKEEVQDEIGNIVAEICETVPNGVLVFLPSYGFMNKLELRWRTNPNGRSLLQRLEKTKKIFWENSSSKQVFKQNMEAYACCAKGGPNYNGSLLFAVYRGKISEGIDFADEQARVVVSVGIPYSNLMAYEIRSKRNYNDTKKRNQRPGELPIMSGSDWYSTQAFRAMNQGLGRCVRHSQDWGAIVLLDHRLAQRRNQPYISSWVKRNMEEIKDFKDLKKKLYKFVVDLQHKDKRRKIQISYERDELECTTQEIPFNPNNSNTETNWDGLSSQDLALINENENLHDTRGLSKPVTDEENWPEMGSQETNFVNENEILNETGISTQSVSVIESVPPDDPQWHDMTTQEASFFNEVLPDVEVSLQLNPEPEVAGVLISSSDHSFNDEYDEDFLPQTPEFTPNTQLQNARNALSSFKMSSETSQRTGSSTSSSVASDLEMSRIADGLQSPLDTGNNKNESVTMDVSMPSADGYSDIEHEISQGSSISYSSE